MNESLFSLFSPIIPARSQACQHYGCVILIYISIEFATIWLLTLTLICKSNVSTLLWRHNGRDSVANHQPHDCLPNHLIRRRSKQTSKLRVTGLCAGNSPGTGECPAQMASNAENVSIWWRHHEYHPKYTWTPEQIMVFYDSCQVLTRCKRCITRSYIRLYTLLLKHIVLNKIADILEATFSQRILLEEVFRTVIQMSMSFVPKDTFNNQLTLIKEIFHSKQMLSYYMNQWLPSNWRICTSQAIPH